MNKYIVFFNETGKKEIYTLSPQKALRFKEEKKKKKKGKKKKKKKKRKKKRKRKKRKKKIEKERAPV